jgi:hypothetical protein
MPEPFDPQEPPFDSDPLDAELPGEDGARGGGIVPDLIRKAVVAGLGAVFMGEEGIRKLAGQLKLPKEVLGYILQQADKTKGDVSRVIGEELRRFLNSELMRQEVLQMLSGMTVEIKAEIRLRPDADAKGGASPKVELTGTSVRRGDKDRDREKPHRKSKKES